MTGPVARARTIPGHGTPPMPLTPFPLTTAWGEGAGSLCALDLYLCVLCLICVLCLNCNSLSPAAIRVSSRFAKWKRM
jgi:hypothetical protein